jgi:hypothetical protein
LSARPDDLTFLDQSVADFSDSLIKNNYVCRDVEHEEEVCRDFLEGPEAQDGLVRKSMKNIWTVEDVTDVDWKQQEPERSFFEVK